MSKTTPPRLIFLNVSGSQSYGMATATSDVDVKGVCFGDPSVYLGLQDRGFSQIEDKAVVGALFDFYNTDSAIQEAANTHGCEGTVYEFRKFLGLALDANPNILEMMFVDERHSLFRCPVFGERLWGLRDAFVSSKCRFTFAGYAHSQLKRIETHRKWILNPPTAKPMRSDFGLPETTLLPKDQLSAVEAAVTKKIDEWKALDLSLVEDGAVAASLLQHYQSTLTEILGTGDDIYRHAGRAVGFNENVVEIATSERRYKAALTHWQQYQDWVKNRNPARAELEIRSGYDTKHAAHLVRLFRQCFEILTTGKITVNRAGIDAEELLAIRSGAWDYDTLMSYATDMDARIEAVYKGGTFVVPKAPDRSRVETFCRETLQEYLAG